MPLWNDCPHTLHDSSPIPPFLSSFTVIEFSWLQNRQGKFVARGSFYILGKHGANNQASLSEVGYTFFGPCGLRDDFLRLPCPAVSKLRLVDR